MEIPYDYQIYDTRANKDFKGITISGYKRTDVIKTFQNSMINNKLEDAIRWGVELHCTGLNFNLWDSLEMIYIRYVHIHHPKLFFYINKRKKDFENIIRKYPNKHEIFTRNNQELRNLYSELIAMITITKKSNIFLNKSLPSIKNTSFEKIEIKKRMISTNFNNILPFINEPISNNIKLGLNEIINNLLYLNGTYQNCYFWYLWIEKLNSKNKENNNLIKYEDYNEYWTFIIWKIILNFENKLSRNNFIFIKKLEELYKNNFKLSCVNKRKYHIFISLYILKNNINWNIPLYNNEHLIIQSCANVNSMYKSVIGNIHSNLSNENIKILEREYNELYYNLNNPKIKEPQKIKNLNLDEDINKVVFTSNIDMYDISVNKQNNNKHDINLLKKQKKEKEQQLIDKNKTLRDVIDKKLEEQNKKLEAYTNFVTYKKKEEKPKTKSVIEYYKDYEKEHDKNNEKEIKTSLSINNDDSRFYKNIKIEKCYI